MYNIVIGIAGLVVRSYLSIIDMKVFQWISVLTIITDNCWLTLVYTTVPLISLSKSIGLKKGCVESMWETNISMSLYSTGKYGPEYKLNEWMKKSFLMEMKPNKQNNNNNENLISDLRSLSIVMSIKVH